MPVFTIVIKFSVLAFLCAAWLLLHRGANALNPGDTYHVAASQRDKRRTRFYFHSVWVALGAAFVGYGTLESLTSNSFESPFVREVVTGSLRGVALWGLLVVAAVWARVGQHAGDAANQSLQPVMMPHDRRDNR